MAGGTSALPATRFVFSSDLILMDCLLLLRVNWKSRVFPRIVSTQQRCCVFDSNCFEVDRRTGGSVFVWSRAIRDYQLVLRQLIRVFHNICVGNQLRTPDVTGCK